MQKAKEQMKKREKAHPLPFTYGPYLGLYGPPVEASNRIGVTIYSMGSIYFETSYGMCQGLPSSFFIYFANPVL